MSTHYIQIHDRIRKNYLNICFLMQSEEFRRDSKNEFKLVMVNEPSVFEQLRFDCTLKREHAPCGSNVFPL